MTALSFPHRPQVRALLAVPGSELLPPDCGKLPCPTWVDVGDVVRHIAILKSNAQFESVAQMPIDCHETVGLGGLGIHAAECAALCGDIPRLGSRANRRG